MRTCNWKKAYAISTYTFISKILLWKLSRACTFYCVSLHDNHGPQWHGCPIQYSKHRVVERACFDIIHNSARALCPLSGNIGVNLGKSSQEEVTISTVFEIPIHVKRRLLGEKSSVQGQEDQPDVTVRILSEGSTGERKWEQLRNWHSQFFSSPVLQVGGNM